MNERPRNILIFNQTVIKLLVLISGFSALSWTVIWQLLSSLALGVSAWGTALTLAVTMGGMCIGSIVVGCFIKKRSCHKPVKMYGIFEILIGLSGLALVPGFDMIEYLDVSVYQNFPAFAHMFHILSVAVIIGVPTILMGATLPVFGLVAEKYKTSIAVLYGLNTFGAAMGSVLAAFVFIPFLTVSGAIIVITSLNIVIGIVSILIDSKGYISESVEIKKPFVTSVLTKFQEYVVVFVTGFATLALEVAWFRSFTAAFHSTTASFSIMLAAVLLSLGVAARISPFLKSRSMSLGLILAFAGIAILLVTPIVERFDYFVPVTSENPFFLFINWFVITFYVTGIPMMFLGISLPWILDDQSSPRHWGQLYAINTFAAVIGALSAGWIFLPALGFSKTAWMVGILVVSVGFFVLSGKKRRFAIASLGVLALTIAVIFESGVGKTRVQASLGVDPDKVRIIKSYDGPDNTISVVEIINYKERVLVIDGFVTTTEIGEGDTVFRAEYMLWMGHLPMLMHPDPSHALVICFGTGQTANALRRENPRTLDIVDINEKVFGMAPYFSSNENVLDDPRITPVVMDGRAYMRRANKHYDVITLEPMPPTFAGMNALYSKEFYEISRDNLTDNGVIAQWLPFHLVSLYHGASIARTFQSVFPNAVLWIDPDSLTGILLGSKDDTPDFGKHFPGLARNIIERPHNEEVIKKSVYFGSQGVKDYGAYGDIVTDNNQLLAYGKSNFVYHSSNKADLNIIYDFLKGIKNGAKHP